ncbi:ribosome recycling factor [Patescibacteria group bacterium]
MADSNLYIDQRKEGFAKTKASLKEELTQLRTGRAQTTLVENLQVEAYGAQTALNQLASLSIADAKTLTIEPWDKTVLKDIEKALSYSSLGFSVVNTGDKLILKVPPMTEENRKDLLKIMNEKIENAKISIRQTRDKIKEEILSAEKNKDITEDDRYKYLADLDNYTGEESKEIDKMAQEKEQEIMTV